MIDQHSETEWNGMKHLGSFLHKLIHKSKIRGLNNYSDHSN